MLGVWVGEREVWAHTEPPPSCRSSGLHRGEVSEGRVRGGVQVCSNDRLKPPNGGPRLFRHDRQILVCLSHLQPARQRNSKAIRTAGM